MINVLKIVCILVSSTIGAGFATGREIVVFFDCNERILPLYIILFMFSFSIMTLSLMFLGKIISKGSLLFRAYDMYLVVCGVLMSGCLLSAIRTMGNTYGTIFGIILSICTLLFAIFINIRGLKSFERLSVVIVPCILLLFFIILKINNLGLNNQNVSNILSPINYSAMNLGITGYILADVGRKYSIREQVWGAIVSSIIIGGIIYFIRSSLYGLNFEYSDMPIFMLASSRGGLYTIFYNILLYLSILSTLICTLSPSTNIMIKRKTNFTLITVIAMLISLISFGFAVKYIYPIIGLLGGVFIMIFVIKLICSNITSSNYVKNMRST